MSDHLPEAEWVGPSLVLVERDADVPVSARTLASLVSYALAGPTNEASTRRRNEAVDEVHRAMAAAYRANPAAEPNPGRMVRVPGGWHDRLLDGPVPSGGHNGGHNA